MKQKTNRSMKSRFKRTRGGKWMLVRAKACNRHRLLPKSKRQKALAWRYHSVSSANIKAVSVYI